MISSSHSWSLLWSGYVSFSLWSGKKSPSLTVLCTLIWICCWGYHLQFASSLQETRPVPWTSTVSMIDNFQGFSLLRIACIWVVLGAVCGRHYQCSIFRASFSCTSWCFTSIFFLIHMVLFHNMHCSRCMFKCAAHNFMSSRISFLPCCCCPLLPNMLNALVITVKLLAIWRTFWLIPITSTNVELLDSSSMIVVQASHILHS
jgi:hypothetical protein